MSVKSTIEGDILRLDLDNGDREKLEQAMKKWSFKDHQSLLRFAVSMLLLNEDKYFSLKIDGNQQNIVPAADFKTDSAVKNG